MAKDGVSVTALLTTPSPFLYHKNTRSLHLESRPSTLEEPAEQAQFPRITTVGWLRRCWVKDQIMRILSLGITGPIITTTRGIAYRAGLCESSGHRSC